MDPDQTVPQGWFHDIIYFEVQLSICNRRKEQTTFSEQRIFAELGLTKHLFVLIHIMNKGEVGTVKHVVALLRFSY